MAISKKKKDRQSVEIIRTEKVPIKSLKLYRRNPRVGNIDAIAESMKFGQFKPIVVNVGTSAEVQNEVLAGNHTLLAARKNGDTEIWASFVDVDDDTAASIVLADNKTSSMGTMDDSILAEILQKLPTLEGTAFRQDEMDAILESAKSLGDIKVPDIDLSGMLGNPGEIAPEKDNRASATSFADATFGEEAAGDDDDDEVGEDGGAVPQGNGVDFEAASESLPGMLTLKTAEEVSFDTIGYWGIPRLRTDMLASFADLPPGLETWAGSASKGDMDPDRWWFYNFGVDSTSGMNVPLSQVILSFYTWDKYFEPWWVHTPEFVAKAINSGIKFAVAPNYSQWSEDPHVVNLYALYRSRWVARYMQEAGIKVIPDINWPLEDDDFKMKHVIATLPKQLPLVAFQMQTFDPTVDMDKLAKSIQEAFDALDPQGVLLYAGGPGREFFEKRITLNCPIKVLETRNNKLGESRKGREKKTTL